MNRSFSSANAEQQARSNIENVSGGSFIGGRPIRWPAFSRQNTDIITFYFPQGAHDASLDEAAIRSTSRLMVLSMEGIECRQS
jgi:hypothetical protein